jgi:hypothetical protein
MKKKDAVATDASVKDAASCCDGCECCSGDAESCPMMKDAAHKGDHAKGAHSCPMMKDAAHKDAAHKDAVHAQDHDKAGSLSCPMKNKGEAKPVSDAVIAEPVAVSDAKSCDCACCQGHKEKMAAPAV